MRLGARLTDSTASRSIISLELRATGPSEVPVLHRPRHDGPVLIKAVTEKVLMRPTQTNDPFI
jgi:hypothetical protein